MISRISKLYHQAHPEYAIRSVWFGCGHHPASIDKGICVEHTMSWLQDIATQLDGPYLGPDDPRVQHFTQLFKK